MARQIGLRRLAGAPQTRAQLADAMRRKGVPDEAAAVVLARFEEVGLVDDAAFAQAWVESRHAGRGLARRALSDELRRRGVAGEIVAEAVDTLDPDQERATARALVAARLDATRGLGRTARIRRLAGLLARRGYSSGVALTVIREALAEEAADRPGRSDRACLDDGAQRWPGVTPDDPLVSPFNEADL